jgi:peptidyl-prolyl cis-trans isomerase B (cyclophilin B)
MFSNPTTKVYDYTAEQLEDFQYAKLTLSSGILWLKLTPSTTPNTVANFATLANDGFYDNLTFHRVIPDFMAQGGCPQGTGTGGPDWNIACETNAPNQIHKRGAISMAHAGKDTGGSQFFICFVDTPHLDGVHTTFGTIEPSDIESFKTLDSINSNDTIEKIEILKSK